MKINMSIACSLLFFSCTSMAAQNPDDLIKYRQSAMMFMRWNVETIKHQLQAESGSYEREKVSAAASAIAGVANTNLRTLFAADTETGTGWKPTLARPQLFAEPDRFTEKLAMLKKQADALARIADDSSVAETQQQFDELFKACQACHKLYRNKP